MLPDENLDHGLRSLLGRHEVCTAAYMGWAGLKNGELLQAAESGGIEVLINGDQTMYYEQNPAGRHLAIVALSAIQLPIVRTAYPLSLPRSTMPGRALFKSSNAARFAGGG